MLMKELHPGEVEKHKARVETELKSALYSVSVTIKYSHDKRKLSYVEANIDLFLHNVEKMMNVDSKGQNVFCTLVTSVTSVTAEALYQHCDNLHSEILKENTQLVSADVNLRLFATDKTHPKTPKHNPTTTKHTQKHQNTTKQQNTPKNTKTQPTTTKHTQKHQNTTNNNKTHPTKHEPQSCLQQTKHTPVKRTRN
ncbi:hypothetical protein J6590_013611 [Homalodisca vitripennis]|nr:hypothetical protein J6590_013611 [Homalodisca vitripennis]